MNELREIFNSTGMKPGFFVKSGHIFGMISTITFLIVLPLTDIVVIGIYLFLLILIGSYFAFSHKSTGYFTVAGGKLPHWVVGLSIFGTFLSSNTFVGVTGTAYGGNWNAFVFSLSLPVAAWVASRYFVPFYRRSGHVSAYEHMESRFGPWARIYMITGYLLTQLARMGSILFGVSLVLQALFDVPLSWLIISLGLLVTLYTMMGGIEAVIWTDVIQSVILFTGAIIILVLIFIDIPGSFDTFLQIGSGNNKFSLGSFHFGFTEPTFWVVMMYGIFINLNNFGVDQSYIQRYHAADSEKAASRSVWLSAGLYIPVSWLFFIIGTGLWVYYQSNQSELQPVRERAIIELQEGNQRPITEGEVEELIADRVMPFYMVERLPEGLTGLLIAALIAASMSSLDTSLNSSATIIWSDIYKRYIKQDPGEKESMRVLRLGTLVWGVLGTLIGVALIGVKSILDAWWQLSGIFAGGMLGLFLLGFVSRKTGNLPAMIAVIIGILLIAWMTLGNWIPEHLDYLRIALHSYMIVVIGTLTIFLTGLLISFVKNSLNSTYE